MYVLRLFAIGLGAVLKALLQREKFQTAQFELHQLLGQPTLRGVPLLVVSLLLHLST